METELDVYAGVLRLGRFSPQKAYVFDVTASRKHDLILDAGLFGNTLRFITDPQLNAFEFNVTTDDFIFESKGLKVPAVLLQSNREAGKELLHPYGPKYWELLGSCNGRSYLFDY